MAQIIIKNNKEAWSASWIDCACRQRWVLSDFRPRSGNPRIKSSSKGPGSSSDLLKGFVSGLPASPKVPLHPAQTEEWESKLLLYVWPIQGEQQLIPQKWGRPKTRCFLQGGQPEGCDHRWEQVFLDHFPLFLALFRDYSRQYPWIFS